MPLSKDRGIRPNHKVTFRSTFFQNQNLIPIIIGIIEQKNHFKVKVKKKLKSILLCGTYFLEVSLHPEIKGIKNTS